MPFATLCKQTRAQFDQMFQERLTKIHATGTSLQDQVPYIVDAIWAAGLGLNATLGIAHSLNLTMCTDVCFHARMLMVCACICIEVLVYIHVCILAYVFYVHA